jgi:ferric-dicitrate binding protein FerR (iron transport regulator)
MMREPDEDPAAPLAALARAHAARFEPPADAVAGAAAWTAFQDGLRRQAAARRRRSVALATIALAVAVGGGRAAWTFATRGRLTYAVEGTEARADGYIPRVQGEHADIKFSDGSLVDLDRGSRAWIVDTGAHGASLRLENGRAHFAVVHRPHTRWSVEAGPFVVAVTGTKFDVEWSGTRDLLRVHLMNGVVTVGGPQTRGGVTLLAGQVLEARPDEGILLIEPAADLAAADVEDGRPNAPAARPETGEAAQPRPLAADAPAHAPVGARAAAPIAGSARRAGTRAKRALIANPAAACAVGADWDQRIGRGDFATVLADAETAGVAACLRALPSDRLAALADAARYAGRPELAREALDEERDRFPGTVAAADATFLLGRLSEDARAPRTEALAWYERYLADAPSGRYASEARGRAMLIAAAENKVGRARELARRYLDASPRGAYAVQARALCEDRP